MRIIYQLPDDWPDGQIVTRLAALNPQCEFVPLADITREGVGTGRSQLFLLFTHELSSSDFLVADLLRPVPTLIVYATLGAGPSDAELALDNLVELIPFRSEAGFDAHLCLQLRHAREARQHTGFQLDALLDNLKTGILFENPERRIEHANVRFCELFDIASTPDVLRGQSGEALARRISGQFAEPEAFVALTERSAAERRVYRDQALVSASGRQFVRHYTPIIAEGVFVGHLWQYDDVTWQTQIAAQLRGANEQLQAANQSLDEQNRLLAQEREQIEFVLTNADTILFVLDGAGTIVRARGKGLSKLGLDPSRYEGMSAYYYTKYAPSFQEVLDTARAGRPVTREVELKPYVFLYTLSPALDAQGQVELMTVFMTDITARKHIEHDLIRARELAESAVEAKERFLASMSHEIRTPLNGIVGLTNLLFTTHPTDGQREYLRGLQASAETLMGILNDVLDLSKVRAGKLDVERVPFSLRSIVANLRRTLEPKVGQQRVQFEVKVPSEVPAVLLGDPTRVSQILWNLLANAFKFTERGTVTLRIGVMERTARRATLELAVSDTGIGIPADRLTAIFDSFTQASPDTSRYYGGTGLGLSIVRELTHLQGGTVGVESSEGVGTTFTVRMSFDIAPEGSQPASTGFVDWASEWIGPYQALVVEDNLVNQLIAKRLLEGWGLEVTVANHGAEAMELLQTQHADLILMDLRMPEMDGYETTQRIRALGTPQGQVPIIAITAQALREEKGRCLEIGMNDYVAKPFDPRRLFQAIIRHLKPQERAMPRSTRTSTSETAAPKPPTPPAPVSDAPRFSLDYLKRFFDGDEAMVADIVRLSIDELGKDLARMAEGYAAGNRDDVSLIAHRMKTNLAQLGDASAAQQLEAIEHLIKRHQGWPTPDDMARAQAEVEQLLGQLRVAFGVVGA